MGALKAALCNPPVFFCLFSLFRGRFWAVSCGRKGSWELDEALLWGEHLWGAVQHGQKSPQAISGGFGCPQLSPQQTAGQVRPVLHDRRHGVCVSGKGFVHLDALILMDRCEFTKSWEKKPCNIDTKLRRERWSFYVNTAKFNVKDACIDQRVKAN